MGNHMAAARSIERVVTPTAAGPVLKRLVGTLDFKGQGTEHELAGMDPVVLCDYAAISGIGQPPFGMHPHYGLIAATIPVEGCFTDSDNLNPPDGHITNTGGVYMVSSGRGCCHMESTATEGAHVAVQTIFKIAEDKKDLLPELIKVNADDIPELGLKGGSAKLMVGRLGDKESPAKVGALPRVVMVIVKADAGAKMVLPLDADLEHGYVYVLKGKCKLAGGQDWCEATKSLYLFGKGAGLAIEAGPEGAQALVYAGKPLNEPWVKLLGRNGFIIAADEPEAEKVMTKIHEFKNEFSFQNL